MSKDDKFGKGFLDELESLSNAGEKKTKKSSSADEVENLLKSTLSEVGIDAEKLRASVKAMEVEKKKEKEEISRLDSILEPVHKPAPEPVHEPVRVPVRETAHGTVHDVLRETVHEQFIEPPREREPRPVRPPERVEIFEKSKPTDKDIFPPLPDKKPAGPRPEPSLQRERFEAPRKKPDGALFDSYAEKPKKKFPVAVVILAAVVVIGGGTAAFMFLKSGKSAAPASSSLLNQNASLPSGTSTEPSLGQNPATSDSGQPAPKQAADPNAKPAGLTANNQRNANPAGAPAEKQGTPVANPLATPADTQPAPAETFQPLVPIQTPRVQDVKPAATQTNPDGGATNPGTAPTPQPADDQPKKAKAGDLIPLEQVDAQPAVTSKVEANYPSMAQRMGIEGTVIVNALVSESGDVIRTAILRKSSSGTNYGFETASEQAVKQWKFKPAMKDGVSVKTWKPVAVIFKK
jgi:protein TonB